MIKAKLLDIASLLVWLFLVGLLILHSFTDIPVNSHLVLIVNAIMFALIGLKQVKSKKYVAYVYFIPAALVILVVIKHLISIL